MQNSIQTINGVVSRRSFHLISSRLFPLCRPLWASLLVLADRTAPQGGRATNCGLDGDLSLLRGHEIAHDVRLEGLLSLRSACRRSH